MALSIVLYTFGKKPNSTARPGDTTANLLRVSGVMRDGCDILFPTVGFQFPQDAPPFARNYAYIEELGRYYFITGWSYSGRLWYASMSVDTMATYKESIGASTQYVTRAAAEFDRDIIDREYPADTGRTVRGLQVLNSPYVSNFAQGSYILGVIGARSGNFGAVTYYVMSHSTISDFMVALLSTIDWAGIDAQEVSEALQKGLINPMQYITSCKWLPVTLPESVSTPANGVALGYWSINVACRKLSATEPYSMSTLTLALPHHPQMATRGEWLGTPPYTVHKIFLHPFGMFAYEPPNPADDAVKLSMRIDLISGECMLYLQDEAGAIVSMMAAPLAVQVPLAQIAQSVNTDQTSMLTALGSWAAGVIGGNTVGGVASALIDNGAGYVAPRSSISTADGLGTALTPMTATFKGGDESPLLYDLKPVVVSIFTPLADDDPERRGRPLCKQRRVDTLPGYQVVNNPTLPLPATETEAAQIRAIMSAGFYYE